ncbi:class I SAM-dependent methyltransferase [Rhodoflexus caldus]|uniref:class I SAM-dependent methyltransferase n=1 Tax=Rhodoflexus caldus TaxID=2891236 RepID=UPI00202A34EC|nr:class I SAM-dependent methyltransferase [Rhodoflexus caldus]
MQAHYPCPDCNGEQFAAFHTCRDYTVSGELFTLARCRQCQMVITQQPPPSEKIGSYYKSEDYVSHSDTKRGLFFRLYHLARGWMLQSKRKLVEKYSGKTNGKLLDWGCGTGYFPAAMQQAGWQVQGIEADEDARNYARQKFSLAVFAPEKVTQLPDSQYDCISFWHVMEHLHDLRGTIANIERLLAPQGIVVVALPNQQSYDAWYYGRYWAAWDVPRHLWHFAPQNIERLMAANGFGLLHKQTMPFDPFYVALLSEKYREKRWGFINGILQGFISLVKGYLNVNQSSSVIYVFSRKRQ